MTDVEQKRLLHGSLKSTQFTRNEIISLYSRFKAICKLSAMENPRQPLVGIDFTTFVKGVPEGNQLHSQLLEKLFHDCDSRKNGILDWASFLQAMIVLRPKTMASSVDSCLNLILQKQRRNQLEKACFTSFDEVRKMCFMGMTQPRTTDPNYKPPEHENNPFANITDYDSWQLSAKHFISLEACMADIYARDFMKRMGYSLREAIPLLEFKEKLLNERHRLKMRSF